VAPPAETLRFLPSPYTACGWTSPDVPESFFTDSLTFRDAASLLYRDKKIRRRSKRLKPYATFGVPERPEAAKTQWVILDFSGGKVRSTRYDVAPDLDKPENCVCALSPDGMTLCLWTHEPKGFLFWNLARREVHRPKALQSFPVAAASTARMRASWRWEDIVACGYGTLRASRS